MSTVAPPQDALTRAKKAPAPTQSTPKVQTAPAAKATPKNNAIIWIALAGVGIATFIGLALVVAVGLWFFLANGKTSNANPTTAQSGTPLTASKSALDVDYKVNRQWQDGKTQYFEVAVSIKGNLKEGDKIALVLVDSKDGNDLRAHIERQDLLSGNFQHELNVAFKTGETRSYHLELKDHKTGNIIQKRDIKLAELQSQLALR